MKNRDHSKGFSVNETRAGEDSFPVFARKHSHSYADERNWENVPSGCVVIGKDLYYGL
jgi:hypothetical protein